MPFVPHNTCQAIFETAGNIIDDQMICFGGEGKDSCQGDSGGPLICVEANTPVLRGIVSFGRGCGRQGIPGMYTRVSNYINWIDDAIERMLARSSCGTVRSAFEVRMVNKLLPKTVVKIFQILIFTSVEFMINLFLTKT